MTVRASEVDERASIAARWVAGYAFIAVGRVTELVPFLHTVPLAKIAFAGVLIAAFAGRAGASAVKLWDIQLVRAATAFMALAVVSVTFSVWKSHSVEFLIATWSTIVIGFFVSLKILVRWSDVRAVLKMLVLAGLILAADALAGYAGGRAQVQSSYDTNDLAYVLTGTLPITIAFGVATSGKMRLLWFGVAALEVATSLLTQSRGGLLSLIAVVALLVWKPLVVTRPTGGRSAGRGALLGRALLAVLLGVAVWTQLPSEARERLASIVSPEQDYNADARNSRGRMSVWTRNVQAVLERPIGYGIDDVTAVDGSTGGLYLTAHNSVLEVFVELGVLGLILWLRLWFLSWRDLAPPFPPSAPESDPRTKRWREQVVFARALRVTLVALFIGGFFLSQAYSMILWQLFTICAALGAMFGTEPKPVLKQLSRVRSHRGSPF